MNNLNAVETKVTIAGKATYFTHLKLHQSFNNHHKFEIIFDFQELDVRWMENPTRMIQLMGEEVKITMQHKESGDINLFHGLITDVSLNGKHGEQNFITISGSSPTIRLEGSPTMDSFTDLTLENIAHESIKSSGNGGEATIKPVYKGSIDYITQHNETCFEFLNRLSYLYGEWFFYNGTSCYFGKPDLDDPVVIIYDVEMSHFDLNAHLIPAKLNRFDYLNHIDNEVNSDTPNTVSGVRGYIKAALDKSNEIYNSDASIPLNPTINSKKELNDMVTVDKYRMISQMLIMKGETQTCKVKIGKLIDVRLPASMQTTLKHVEIFLVTEIIHEADQSGAYHNRFTAIPSEMENIPMQPVQTPIALPQIAWVVTNADNKGQVKVQFQYQKRLNKTTNWIRVQTPDGGGTAAVPKNRGFVFIPEAGDQVIINFENGDPNRPYVSGSLFPENKSIGGGIDNHKKSIMTRSGIKIVIDDQQNSIYIEDPSGNIWFMDGNGNIEVSAPNKIKLNSKDIEINAKNDLSISVKNNFMTSVGQIFNLDTTMLNQTVATAFNMQSATAFLGTKENIQLQSEEIVALGMSSVKLHSDNSIIANSLGVMDLFSNDAMTLAQAAQPNPPTPLTSISLGVVNFRPLDDYDGEYGVDWFRMGDYTANGFTNEYYWDIIKSGYVTPPAGAAANAIHNLSQADARTRAYTDACYRALPINFPAGHVDATCEYKKDYFPLFLNIYSNQAKDKIKALYTVASPAPAAASPTPPFTIPDPVSSVDLNCNIEVFEDLDKIEVELNNEYFEIDNPILSNTIAADSVLTIQRKITCRMNYSDPVDASLDAVLQDFGFKNEQEILVWGYPKDSLTKTEAEQKALRKVMGRIIVMPNDISHRKHVDIVYANVIVKIDASASDTAEIDFPDDAKKKLFESLHQALITCTITEGASLDLRSDTKFKRATAAQYTAGTAAQRFSSLTNTYIYPDGHLYTLIDNLTSNGIFDYIRDEYIRQHPEYANHFTVFHIGLDHKMEYRSGANLANTFLAGQVKDIGSKCVLLYNGFVSIPAVTAHEIMHCLDLEHSFDNSMNNSRNLAAAQNLVYTFEATSNLMDYSTKLLNLWNWQWEVAQRGLSNELELPSPVINIQELPLQDSPIEKQDSNTNEPDILMA